MEAKSSIKTSVWRTGGANSSIKITIFAKGDKKTRQLGGQDGTTMVSNTLDKNNGLAHWTRKVIDNK